jgi:hypothetical protein
MPETNWDWDFMTLLGAEWRTVPFPDATGVRDDKSAGYGFAFLPRLVCLDDSDR